MDIRIEGFLESHDHCRIASIDKQGGFPHCVPIAYLYHKGFIYIPTSSRSKKVRSLYTKIFLLLVFGTKWRHS